MASHALYGEDVIYFFPRENDLQGFIEFNIFKIISAIFLEFHKITGSAAKARGRGGPNPDDITVECFEKMSSYC